MILYDLVDSFLGIGVVLINEGQTFFYYIGERLMNTTVPVAVITRHDDPEVFGHLVESQEAPLKLYTSCADFCQNSNGASVVIVDGESLIVSEVWSSVRQLRRVRRPQGEILHVIVLAGAGNLSELVSLKQEGVVVHPANASLAPLKEVVTKHNADILPGEWIVS
jgi:hypothetical protein